MSCGCTGEFANVYLSINNLEGNFNAITGNTLSNYNQLSRIVSQQANIYNTVYYGAGNLSTGNLSVSANALITGNLSVSANALISGNLVISNGNVGIGTSNPLAKLNVSGGNILCSGSVQPQTWITGQVIQVMIFNKNNTTPSQYVFSSTTYATWVTVSFTPKSNNSNIIVQADSDYIIDGNASSGDENFFVRVTDNSIVQFEKNQRFDNGAGGGTRSSVLIPLICSYNNITTASRNIAIQIKRGSGADDNITFSSSTNTNWSLTITEIQA